MGLCDGRRINRANVKVVSGDHETDALALVIKAQRQFSVDRDFDRVFVVCDCAGEDLSEARALASKTMRNSSGTAVQVELILSRPCFELWLLLHFEYVAKPFRAAVEVVNLLKRHITDYDKADRRIFEKVATGLDRASQNAKRLKAELATIGATSPDTDMAVLAEVLLELCRPEL